MKKANAGVGGRFHAIDGMRGIAAISVVVYHMSADLKSELTQLMPEFIYSIFSYGYLGVPVFFVISGFVISLSMGNSRITANYAAMFAIRRQLRLDPTYWASILFALILLQMKNQILGASEPTPSFGNILAHMFYLQELLSIKPVISVVYWTLCLEVQLYLFYLFTLWASQRFAAGNNLREHIIHLLIIVSVGICSVSLDLAASSSSIPALFLSNWHYFLMGVLVSGVVRKLPYSIYILVAWIILEIVLQLSVKLKPYVLAGIFSSMFIYVLWRHDLLDTALTRKEFQYLGRISYTLYLVHPDVGWKAIAFGKLVLADYMSPVLGGLLFLFGIFVSIAVAHLFHLAFEKPSLWLCTRLRGLKVREASQEISESLKYLTRAIASRFS